MHRLRDPQTLEEEVRQESSAILHRSTLNQPGSSGIDRSRGLFCLISLWTGDEISLLPLRGQYEKVLELFVCMMEGKIEA